mgnify:CR=1 FL=1|jgi:5'-3' exonuclease
MRQVIRKAIANAYNIDTSPIIYTLIVDGNNLLKISSVDKRLNGKNEEYGIVYQFLWQIKNILQKRDFNFCYVMWDGEKSGQLRYQYYQDYKISRGKTYEISGSKSEYDKQIESYCKKVIDYHKKNNKKEVKREETDEENFERQQNILFSALEELFVRQVICDEVEGDDLIAYYVKNKKPNEKIVIISGDRDLTQLISDDVCVYIPSLKKFITPDNHIKEIGYTHENVLIKKMICGDNSDSIKGIKGVGEKTFFDLFPEAKTSKMDLESILRRSQELIDERIANKKKPLESTKNIINRVTIGCQGKDIYEINKKIIDLKEPLLTKEAKEELDALIHAPLDPENRSFKNLYTIIQENDMVDLLDEGKFSNFFSAYHKLIDNEVKYYNS